ncbi:hypothetical protein G9A89_022249 [Geosiphon pyriformis]|nr:hypothetical protein G9A89_022249 [Geosiphon pyriformis]
MLNWNIQELQLSQNGQYIRVPATCKHFKTTTTTPLIEFEKEEKKPTWKAYQRKKKKKTSHKKIPSTKLPVAEKVSIQLTPDQSHPISHSSTKTARKSSFPWELGLHPTKTTKHKSITITNHVTVNTTATQNTKASGTINHVLLVTNNCSMKGSISCLDDYPHNEGEIWRMVNAKIEDALPSEILEIKNNPSKPVKVVLIPNPDAFLDIETGPEKFYEHYQNLAPT